jgi:nitrate reductase assembly molybdenum cofactor insertion protein NarJ
MFIDGYIITLDLQEVKGHTAQLQKIGANVNQIAKRINETGRIYADDIDEIKRVMEEVWRLERRLLLQFKGLTK